MGIFRKTGKVVQHIIDFRADRWFHLEERNRSLSRTMAIIRGLFQPLFSVGIEESYEQAIDRLGLSEEDIDNIRAQFSLNVFIFATCTLSFFIYSVYLISQNSLHGFFIAFSMSLYSGMQMFRYHFWLFQLRKQKLGCSFQEWLSDKS